MRDTLRIKFVSSFPPPPHPGRMLRKDKEEAEAIKHAKALEEEKAMYSVRRAENPQLSQAALDLTLSLLLLRFSRGSHSPPSLKDCSNQEASEEGLET